MTNNLDLDLWPWPSIPCKLWLWPTHTQKFMVNSQSIPKIEWKQTDRRTNGQTDGQTDEGDYITSLANAIGKYRIQYFISSMINWQTGKIDKYYCSVSSSGLCLCFQLLCNIVYFPDIALSTSSTYTNICEKFPECLKTHWLLHVHFTNLHVIFRRSYFPRDAKCSTFPQFSPRELCL